MWPISIPICSLHNPARAMTVRVVVGPSEPGFARWWRHVMWRISRRRRPCTRSSPELHPLLSDPVANPELIVDEEYGILLYQLSFDVPGWPVDDPGCPDTQLSFDVPGWPVDDPDAPIPLAFERD